MTNYSQKQITLKTLVNTSLKKTGISRFNLVKRMGYKNISKGLRRLDNFLQNLQAPSDDFIYRLFNALNIERESFYPAAVKTAENLNSEASNISKANFKPFIEIPVEINMKPSFFSAIARQKYSIRQVPENVRNLTFQNELSTIYFIFKMHCLNLQNIIEAGIAGKSTITGFRYHREHDRFLDFDKNGNLKKIVHTDKTRQNSDAKLTRIQNAIL